jgi:hypothetical protein
MECLKQPERCGNVAGARVGQRGPAVLKVSLDGRTLFGESPFEADVAVDVAVGQVVNDLPDRPIALTALEMPFRKAGSRPAQGGRGAGQDGDQLRAPLRAVSCQGPAGYWGLAIIWFPFALQRR